VRALSAAGGADVQICVRPVRHDVRRRPRRVAAQRPQVVVHNAAARTLPIATTRGMRSARPGDPTDGPAGRRGGEGPGLPWRVPPLARTSRTGPQAEAIGSSPVDRGKTGSKHRDGSTRLARFGAGRELRCALSSAQLPPGRLPLLRLPEPPRGQSRCDLHHILGPAADRFRASNCAHSARLLPAFQQVSTAFRTGYLPWRRSAD
jgi:hypothetical protein